MTPPFSSSSQGARLSALFFNTQDEISFLLAVAVLKEK